MTNRPQYGVPWLSLPEGIEADIRTILHQVNRLSGGIDVAIQQRTIAGLSITEVTDELTISPAEIVDGSRLQFVVTPRPTAQADVNYILSVTLDGIEQPLQLVKFTQAEIDAGDSIDLELAASIAGISVIIATVELDPNVAIVALQDIITGVVGEAVTTELLIDTGLQGLSGFTATVDVSDINVAVIQSLSFPTFPVFSEQVSPDGSNALFSAVDLSNVVLGSQMGVILAEITLAPLAVGSADLTVTFTGKDGDAGEEIRCVLSNGRITVV